MSLPNVPNDEASDEPPPVPPHTPGAWGSYVPLADAPDTAAAGVWKETVLADLRELRAADVGPVRRRRRVLPLLLFLATCLSTFWAGATDWMPMLALSSSTRAYLYVVSNWQQGLIYMTAVLAILLTHEMGHFLFTLRYRIPASFPLFIPVPVNAIGTMGAVIGMDGLKANRRQLFDIGLAGPLAGLVVAIPIMWIGIERLDLTKPPGEIAFHNPLLVQWLIGYLRHDLASTMTVGIRQLNPFYFAGWVGLLITGLNMLPISQLDGGHVTYALFRRRAHRLARGFLVMSIVFLVWNINRAYIWTMMLILVILMGTDHPRTSDDSVTLGPFRWTLGVASLVIPILCFPLWGIEM